MLAWEGRLPIAATVVVAVTIHVAFGFLAAIGVWAVVVVLGYLYRDPDRVVPSAPLALVAPSDGHAASVRHATDPWLKREVLRIGIRLPWLGIGPLRSPTEGKVTDYRLVQDAHGKTDSCVMARRAAVCHAIWVRTDEGDDVVLVVSSRWSFHRLKLSVSVGERIGQGQRCGFSHFGTRVDVLAPNSTRAEISSGQGVAAGSTVIATLVHD